MKEKPPYYELDRDTRRFVELTAHWALELSRVQTRPEAQQDIQSVVSVVCDRFGLELEQPTGDLVDVTPAQVIRFPFRVISPSNSKEEDSEQ